MKKLIWIAGVLLLCLVGARAASRAKSEIVIRESAEGWRMFVFGPACPGTLTILNPTDSSQPIQVVCKEGAK